jgi:hypothetical protein
MLWTPASRYARAARSTMVHRRLEFKRQYDIAVQLRADGLLEDTEISTIKKEIVTETTNEDEDGPRGDKAFTKEGLALRGFATTGGIFLSDREARASSPGRAMTHVTANLVITVRARVTSITGFSVTSVTGCGGHSFC